MRTKIIKCIDFDINCSNSDAVCFTDEFVKLGDNYFPIKSNVKKSKKCVKDNPSICGVCPYNEDYKDMNYTEWKEFMKIKNREFIIDSI